MYWALVICLGRISENLTKVCWIVCKPSNKCFPMPFEPAVTLTFDLITFKCNDPLGTALVEICEDLTKFGITLRELGCKQMIFNIFEPAVTLTFDLIPPKSTDLLRSIKERICEDLTKFDQKPSEQCCGQ